MKVTMHRAPVTVQTEDADRTNISRKRSGFLDFSIFLSLKIKL
jgi:hypothetical protein